MEKFTLYRIDDKSDMFLVIPKENEELPLIVHGMLKVYGKEYATSFCARNSISDELTMSGEIKRLEEEARVEYFQVD